MKSYYRIALKRGQYAEEALNGGFICTGFLPNIDLTGKSDKMSLFIAENTLS